MFRRLGGLLLLLASCPGLAQEPGTAPGRPAAEARKVVDAVIGRWSGRMIAIVPGEQPETFAYVMDCRVAALGLGAMCKMGGRPSNGPISRSCVIGYEPADATVHYMCVTSMGEVHDHRGRWINEDTIEFEPLESTWNGRPVVEQVAWTFPGRQTIKTRSVVETAEGTKMTFEFDGERQWAND